MNSILIYLLLTIPVLSFRQNIPVKSYVRTFNKNLDDIKVIEPHYVSKGNTSAILFFTGGSSAMIPEIYQDFLTTLASNKFSIYSPSFRYKNIPKLIKELNTEYKNVMVMGHSSGATTAINQCKNSKYINTLILMDAVDTNILKRKNKKLEVNYIRNIIFLNAQKTYQWNFRPFGPPFIPFKKLILDEKKMILKKECNIKKYTFEKYGHCDILDKPYSDIMHYAKLSIGNTNRTSKNSRYYHNNVVNIIRNNLKKKKNIEDIIY